MTTLEAVTSFAAGVILGIMVAGLLGWGIIATWEAFCG